MECHGKNSDSQLVPCCIATKPSSDLVFVTLGKQVSVFHSRCVFSGVPFRLRLISSWCTCNKTATVVSSSTSDSDFHLQILQVREASSISTGRWLGCLDLPQRRHSMLGFRLLWQSARHHRRGQDDKGVAAERCWRWS